MFVCFSRAMVEGGSAALGMSPRRVFIAVLRGRTVRAKR